jgi:hypothetical protein
MATSSITGFWMARVCAPRKGRSLDRANNMTLQWAQSNHLSIPHDNSGAEEVIVSLGLLMLGDAPVKQLAGRVRLAESCGFNTIWLADERFYREG